MFSKVLGCRLQAAVSPIVLLLFASPPSPSLPLPRLLLLLLSLLLLLILLPSSPSSSSSPSCTRSQCCSALLSLPDQTCHQDYKSYCNY